MRITFNLSFDEYRDSQAERVRRPSRNTAILIVLFSILILVVVFSFWRFLKAFDIEITLSLFAFLMIAFLYSWRSEPTRSQVRFEEKLRIEYQRSYRGEFEAEIREAGWNWKSSNGEDIRRWSQLTYFREGLKSFMLVDDSRNYVLPKRAIPEDLQASLRLWVCEAMLGGDSTRLFSFHYDLTTRDYVQARFGNRLHKHTTSEVGTYLLGLLILSGFYWMGVDGDQFGRPLAFNLFILGLILMLCWESCLYVLRFSQMGEHFNSTVTVHDKGLAFSCPECDHILPFSLFRDFLETRSTFLIYTIHGAFYMFPKRVVPVEDQSQFRELLRGKVSPEFEPPR